MNTRDMTLPDLKNLDADAQVDYVKNMRSTHHRQFVAMSPYASDEVLDYMTKDSCADVRASVANRMDSHCHYRNHDMRDDRNPVVTQAIATNALTASYTLAHLAQTSRDHLTLLLVRDHQNTPEEYVQRLVDTLY